MNDPLNTATRPIDDSGLPECFVLEIKSGGPDELCNFLKSSHAWLSEMSEPPSMEVFKEWIEAGSWPQNSKWKSQWKAPDKSYAEKESCLERIRIQATELDKYNKQEKDPESEFIMHEKIGKFMNLYLEDFLDAAATQTDFKEARYEASWLFLETFFVAGQCDETLTVESSDIC